MFSTTAKSFDAGNAAASVMSGQSAIGDISSSHDQATQRQEESAYNQRVGGPTLLAGGGEEGSLHQESGRGNDNGSADAAGNGDAAAENGLGKENGEIVTNADKKKKEEGEEGGEADMEIEPPPKEDVMVDYTDEFGRVRTMLQR